MKYVLVDNLTKVFPQDSLNEFSYYDHEQILINETLSFQVAFIAKDTPQNVSFQIECDSFEILQYSVELVPSALPAYKHAMDDNYITSEPGMFPDLLRPITDKDTLPAPVGQWRAIWVELKLKNGMADSIEKEKNKFTVHCKSDGENETYELEGSFEVIEDYLPKQELIYTRWFHCDGICQYHHVAFASEAFFDIAKNYIEVAVQHGMNMILTPLFTPPLDTKIGGERLTTQLVDVAVEEGRYLFGFDKLDKWIALCREAGITYFEMSHLFTQWGAKHAPKIMGYEYNDYRQLFGWHTDAFGNEYISFVTQFLESLTDYFECNNLREFVYFHVSDEPEDDHIDNYKKAKSIMEPYIKGYKLMDALSNTKYYDEGIVELPVVATTHIEPFVEKSIEEFWCYYCMAQSIDVSNIFMSMSHQRIRVIGYQWYKYDIKGFLHWAYNFYNSRYSLAPIDPYRCTDADSGFPSGDSFVVYPTNGGCLGSLRLKVLKHAIDDYGLMKRLSDYKGTVYVKKLIDEEAGMSITFSSYPTESNYIKKLRRRILEELKQEVKIKKPGRTVTEVVNDVVQEL